MDAFIWMEVRLNFYKEYKTPWDKHTAKEKLQGTSTSC